MSAFGAKIRVTSRDEAKFDEPIRAMCEENLAKS